jgi:opacity protein-like surface antigen
MKKTLIAIAVVPFLLGFCTPSHAVTTGNFNFLIGGKSLEKNDWEPLEDQAAVSFHLDVTPEGWPLALSLDLLGSSAEEENYADSGFDFKASTSELDFGVRKFFGDPSDAAGFIGGGLGLIGAEAEVTFGGLTESEDDSALGFWLDAGIQGRFFEAMNLGVELRYSKAEVSIGGVDVEAGGTTFGVFIGYGW